jgi:hypothetical protein
VFAVCPSVNGIQMPLRQARATISNDLIGFRGFIVFLSRYNMAVGYTVLPLD